MIKIKEYKDSSLQYIIITRFYDSEIDGFDVDYIFTDNELQSKLQELKDEIKYSNNYLDYQIIKVDKIYKIDNETIL